MASEEVYVDPAAGNDTTGDGTVGTPWKTVQHALDTYEESGSQGTRINVKAGTADTLTASLDDTTFLSNNVARSATKPVVIQGYTTTAGDGGIGEIDGDGTYAIINDASASYWKWIDMKLGNTGSVEYLLYTNSTSACCINCEFHSSTGITGIRGPILYNCYIHGVTKGLYQGTAYGCFFDGVVGTDFVRAMYQGNAFNCIFRLGTTALGLVDMGSAVNNTILSAGCTTTNGYGISMNYSFARQCINNIVEGFTGTGNVGIVAGASNYVTDMIAHNTVYNCTAEYSLNGMEGYVYDNEELEATPLTKGTYAYATRYDYFMPKDVGNVRGGAWPSGCRMDKGAVQHADPAGGGGGGPLIDGRLAR